MKHMALVGVACVLFACGSKDKDKGENEVKGQSTTAPAGGEGEGAAPTGGEPAAKVRTSEARTMVKKLADGARAYYMEAGGAGASMEPVAPQFPEPSAGPSPAPGSCCNGDDHKCAPDAALWTDTTWVALMFSVDDPHYYSYQYEVADDGQSFTARAIGDLDCDGTFSTFELVGTVEGDAPTVSALKATDELE